MLSLRTLSLAVAATFAAAPLVVIAQDTTTTTDTTATTTENTTSTTSGKRFSVAAGYSHLVPKSNAGNVGGADIDIDGGGAPTLSAAYHVNDNVAVELWGMADAIEHDVNTSTGVRGKLEQQPVALSGQYHFGTPDQPIRPYLGLGYYESNINEEQLGGAHFGASTPKGAIATAGADFNITDRWFTRADVRYMQGDSDIEVNGAKVGEVQLDPWVVGVGIGTRF